MADSSDENTLAAQRVQDQFDFYILALTFTVLGFALQTARFGTELVAAGLELLAWAVLLSSGIIGIRRLEAKPGIYRLFGMRNLYEGSARTARRAKLQGVKAINSLEDAAPHPTADVLANMEGSVKRIDETLKPQLDRLSNWYRAQRWTLLVGLLILGLARGYLPATQIVSALLGS